MPRSIAHLPVLAIACSMTFGGLMPFWNPQQAMLAYGYSPRIAATPDAGPVMVGNAGRSTATGLGILFLYAQGRYSSVDTMVAALAYAAAVDTWLVAEANAQMAWVKGLTGVFCLAWGAMGLTQRFGR